MPLKGYIEDGQGHTSKPFEIPDPPVDKMTERTVRLTPNRSILFFWARDHLLGKGGGGRAFIKEGKVGTPLASVDLPKIGANGTLTDAISGRVIHLERTK